MRRISVFLLISFLLGLWLAYSQSPRDSLLVIINSNDSIDLKQHKIDLFFEELKFKFPKEVLAECYHEVGNKWYFNNWLHSSNSEYLDSAISHTSQAVNLKRGIKKPPYTSLKKSLYNLGFFQSRNSEFYKAIKIYLELVDLGYEDEKTVLALYRLAENYNEVGDYQKATSRLNDVIEYYKLNPVHETRLFNAHMELAGTYSLINSNEYAFLIIEHLRKADSIYLSLEYQDSFKKIRIAQQKGNLFINLGKYNQAIDELMIVQDLDQELSNRELAYNYNSLGVCFDKLGLEDEAEFHFFRAIELYPEYSSPFENLGDMYRDNGNNKKALSAYQLSIEISSNSEIANDYKRNPTSEELSLARDKTYLLKHLLAKANFLIEYYKSTGNVDYISVGLKTFELSDELIDLIRIESTEPQTQLYWREQSSNLYMKAVEACYLLNEPEKAYYFMERNKALLLLENISNERAKDISRLPDSVAQREFELKRKIYLTENELNNAGPDANTQVIRDSIFRHKREFEIFLDDVETRYPDYARLKTQLDILAFENFKSEYLGEDQIVLQYILNEEQGYGLMHSNSGSVFFNIKDAPLIGKKLRELNNQLSNYDFQENGQAYSDFDGGLFYTLLPENGLDLVQGKKLLVIPDYELQKIPFEALVIQKDPIKYLIEETEIGYAYSASYLHSKKDMVMASKNGLLSIAPVTFGPQGLAKLGFSLDEVEGISEIIGGDVYRESNATKDVFLKFQDDYKILHLSTHADLDENGNHWVAFRDAKLHLNEIYANKNQAEMVVLSACNTSRGDMKKGEGVMSLARAFFNSGAKSVVSSLWTVQDRAGKEIMLEFYRGLDDGMNKSQALRNAKLIYLQNNKGKLAHPFLWASLIVIGDNSALKSSATLWDFWPMLLAIFLMVLFFLRRSGRYKSSPGLSNPLP